MSNTFYIKQGNLLPILDATLYDGVGVVDLTSAGVNFVMKDPATGTVKVNAACTIVSATGGHVQYVWAGTDTNTALVYQGEFQVTFASGKIETFPNDEYLRIVVSAKLV